MRPEHVRIQQAERIFSEKNLLHSQLDIISMIKKYEAYKMLRNEELLLKITMKNKIAEIQESIALLDKILPKPVIVPKIKMPHENNQGIHAAHKRKQTLEMEVEEIRRKLATLS